MGSGPGLNFADSTERQSIQTSKLTVNNYLEVQIIGLISLLEWYQLIFQLGDAPKTLTTPRQPRDGVATAGA